jgi:hypothetical protein
MILNDRNERYVRQVDVSSTSAFRRDKNRPLCGPKKYLNVSLVSVMCTRRPQVGLLLCGKVNKLNNTIRDLDDWPTCLSHI